METETAHNHYNVKTAAFQGPFALLLSLVEGRKLFINDVSLAEVTEDYIKHVNALGERDPAEVSSFIVVAATLILIKSKSLLPNLDLTDGEESDIVALEERLRQYQLYTRLAGNVKALFGKNMIFAPEGRKNDVLVFLPDEAITKESMMTFARDALGRIPKKVFLSEVEVKKVISIDEMIDKLTERITNSLNKINFKEFSGRAVSREEKVVVIVSFLAMLELTRQGIIHVTQENNFEDIIMEKPSGDESWDHIPGL
ncbi:MAG: segregation/condensation protein A [bacterium]